VDFKKIADQAKAAIDKRGGTESLKEDLGELKNIASGEGSLTDKAKEAADALKDPGDAGPDAPAATSAGAPPAATTTRPAPEQGDPERGQGKHRQHRGRHPGRELG